MRNMSFSMTTQQMKDRTKTVTRRFGWPDLKPGDRVMAIVKGMGLKKGEKVERLYPIEVVSCRWEPLEEIDKEDCIKEGFPDMSPEEFIFMMNVHFSCPRTKKVNRIEFREVEDGNKNRMD